MLRRVGPYGDLRERLAWVLTVPVRRPGRTTVLANDGADDEPGVDQAEAARVGAAVVVASHQHVARRHDREWHGPAEVGWHLVSWYGGDSLDQEWADPGQLRHR